MDEQEYQRRLAAFMAERSDPVRFPLGPFGGEYSESGVDISLIRHMLSMTPLERVIQMEQRARETLQLMEHVRKSREIGTRSTG